jgi:hypothetical protein
MEYYLAVRMRRFGRAFQPTESTPDRGPDRTVSHGSSNGSAGPVVAGVSTAPRIDMARPMSRTSSRPPRF